VSLFESTGIPHPAFFLPANRSCGVYPSGLLSEFGALPFQLAGVTPREPQIPAPPKILLPPPLSSKKILGPRGNSKPLLPVKTTLAKGPPMPHNCSDIAPRTNPNFCFEIRMVLPNRNLRSGELSLLSELPEPPARPRQLAGIFRI